MLYTRKGDAGETGLFGTEERFPKDHSVLEALGSVDELNALIGLIRAYANERSLEETADELYRVQEMLFVIQAELAGADKHLEQADIDALEQIIEEVEARIEKPSSFLVPGTTVLSALFDLARTVSRRAEREVIAARSDKVQRAELTAYINRLSSFFYAFAREATRTAGQTEPSPTYTRAT